MSTLFQDILIDREFGRSAVRTADLRKWASDHNAVIPPALPAIDDFDVVHLESLLCAIERAVPSISDEVIVTLAKQLPCDPKARLLLEKGNVRFSRWLVAGSVHVEWRQRLMRAISSGELRVIDVLSGLPVAMVTPVHSPSICKQSGDAGWIELAQEEARKIIKREAAVDRYPPQIRIAEEIAADFRSRKPPVHGTDGKPMSGASIKRRALGGISSATKKARSTVIRQGK